MKCTCAHTFKLSKGVLTLHLRLSVYMCGEFIYRQIHINLKLHIHQWEGPVKGFFTVVLSSIDKILVSLWSLLKIKVLFPYLCTEHLPKIFDFGLFCIDLVANWQKTRNLEVKLQGTVCLDRTNFEIRRDVMAYFEASYHRTRIAYFEASYHRTRM